MRKQSLIIITLFMSTLLFAQKRELRDAEKAIRSSNFAEANSALESAKAMMSQMDEDLKSKYYYLKAEALYAEGKGSYDDIQQATENLGKVTSDYVQEAGEFKTKMANELLKKGNDLYTNKDYSKSSKYFEQSYRLSPQDTTFLYYAAATALNVQEYKRALKLYEELRDLGYTGVHTEYFATNKESGEEEVFDKATWELYKKSNDYIKPGTRQTESKRPEIIKNIALIYINEGDNDKAIGAIKAAREEDPNDVNLVLNEANIYLKTGDKEKFKELLEKATEMDPTNPELYYNLGVVASQNGEAEQAKTYYEKSIELDPQYINAYINLAVLTLADEKDIIKEMNGLGNSAADNKRYDELKEKRQDLYKNAVPYLTKAMEIDSENVDAAQTLMNIYSILGETEKYKEMKAKVAELQGN
ncbi:tetratricopeptide repeat protein [Gaetbulibacter aestuarii]|uniref:Tetratricopeptide repeat protein n=1 Tax=Gaetbulibacter aestuarii TaxID=1502358 RepID=A0ABW7MZQ7_9FLAO